MIPSLTQLEVRGISLSRTVRQLEAVDEEFVCTDREEDVVQVEEPGHVDWLGVERPLPAVDLHEDPPAAPVPHLRSALKYLQINLQQSCLPPNFPKIRGRFIGSVKASNNVRTFSRN